MRISIPFPSSVVLLVGLFASANAAATCGAAATAPDATAAPQNSYPNSAKGLERLVQDLLAAKKNGDENAFREMVRKMVLPDPDGWFRETFGEENGTVMVKPYLQKITGMEESLSKGFGETLANGLTHLRILRFSEPCSPGATEAHNPVLWNMRKQRPLYEARFLAADWSTGVSLWYFAYVDGAFRYLGKVDFTPSFPAPTPGVHRERVPNKIQQEKLIKRVTPTYPAVARRDRIDGTVRIVVLIGTDGKVRALQAISGPCLLAQAAVEAVRKWVYSPLLLNGKPAEVETTIDVIFVLSG